MISVTYRLWTEIKPLAHDTHLKTYSRCWIHSQCVQPQRKKEKSLVASQLPRCSFYSLNVSSGFLSSYQFLCKKTSITKLARRLPAHRETIRKRPAINNISGCSRDGRLYCWGAYQIMASVGTWMWTGHINIAARAGGKHGADHDRLAPAMRTQKFLTS